MDHFQSEATPILENIYHNGYNHRYPFNFAAMLQTYEFAKFEVWNLFFSIHRPNPGGILMDWIVSYVRRANNSHPSCLVLQAWTDLCFWWSFISLDVVNGWVGLTMQLNTHEAVFSTNPKNLKVFTQRDIVAVGLFTSRAYVSNSLRF